MEVPPSLSDTSARSIASQMTSAVEGRVEHAFGHAIVLQQQVMSVLEVERAAEVELRDDEDGVWEGADRKSRRLEMQLHDLVEGRAGSKGCE
jgi:hypothetical protein